MTMLGQVSGQVLRHNVIGFPVGSSALPASLQPALQRLLHDAAARRARLQVIGDAEQPALAMERARSVALALVELGADAGRIEITVARDHVADQAHLLLKQAVTP